MTCPPQSTILHQELKKYIYYNTVNSKPLKNNPIYLTLLLLKLALLAPSKKKWHFSWAAIELSSSPHFG